jgi:hypothetical protein
VTGWKGVFVNRGFTRRIQGVTKDESDVLLQYLFNVSCPWISAQEHDSLLTNLSSSHKITMPKYDSSGGRTISPSGTTGQPAIARRMTTPRREREIVCALWARSRTWIRHQGLEEKQLPMMSEEKYWWTEAIPSMVQGHLHQC